MTEPQVKSLTPGEACWGIFGAAPEFTQGGFLDARCSTEGVLISASVKITKQFDQAAVDCTLRRIIVASNVSKRFVVTFLEFFRTI